MPLLGGGGGLRKGHSLPFFFRPPLFWEKFVWEDFVLGGFLPTRFWEVVKTPFLGTPGPGAHSHIDNVDLSSWQAQVTVLVMELLYGLLCMSVRELTLKYYLLEI